MPSSKRLGAVLTALAVLACSSPEPADSAPAPAAQPPSFVRAADCAPCTLAAPSGVGAWRITFVADTSPARQRTIRALTLDRDGAAPATLSLRAPVAAALDDELFVSAASLGGARTPVVVLSAEPGMPNALGDYWLVAGGTPVSLGRFPMLTTDARGRICGVQSDGEAGLLSTRTEYRLAAGALRPARALQVAAAGNGSYRVVRRAWDAAGAESTTRRSITRGEAERIVRDASGACPD